VSHDYIPIPSISTDIYQVEETYQTIASLILTLSSTGFTSEAADLQLVLDDLVAEMAVIKAAVA
jgi:hypothetical protein